MAVSATVFEILTLKARQESCAIAKMTTRCALYKWIDWAVAEIYYGHSKFSKMAAGRHLGFDVIRNSAIRSADPENPTLEPNMQCIGSPVAEIWPFAYFGAYVTPFWGKGRSWVSTMAPFERAMVVSYRLSIVTVALSVTIRPQFAIECLRRSNQQGCVTLGQNFRVFPLEQ